MRALTTGEEFCLRITVKHLVQVLSMLDSSCTDGAMDIGYREGVMDSAAHMAACTAVQDFGCDDGVPTCDARDMLELDLLPESPGEMSRHLSERFRKLIGAYRS